MHPPSFILLLFLTLLPSALSARSTATSFCKCVCSGNSTIIVLKPPDASSSSRTSLFEPRFPVPEDSGDSNKSRQNHKLSCADCNRAFCLDYNLPNCTNAREEDVFATCFQRDSVKDETVVLLFIITTAGLLGWALLKPFFEKVRDRRYKVMPSTPSSRPGTNLPTAADDIRDEPQSRQPG